MKTTAENLKDAFAGESQAYQKYMAFAAKADADGFPRIAKLFRTTAEAERLHAAGHFQAMDGVKDTAANLEAAIGGETWEFEDMYPPMLEQAIKEGHKVRRMFSYAVEAEKVHAELYGRALAAAKAGQDLDTDAFYLCPVCGHIEFGQPTEPCPICKVAASKYVLVA